MVQSKLDFQKHSRDGKPPKILSRISSRRDYSLWHELRVVKEEFRMVDLFVKRVPKDEGILDKIRKISANRDLLTRPPSLKLFTTPISALITFFFTWWVFDATTVSLNTSIQVSNMLGIFRDGKKVRS